MSGRGLFLDLDGTLADSLPSLFESYLRVLEEHGVSGSEEEFETLNGIPLTVIVERLCVAHELSVAPPVLLERYERIVRETHLNAPAQEGARELLETAYSMALAAGTRLGPYEIVELRGKGGMGEVYRARDTRLGRDVAVKVLPSELSRDPTFRQRFEREAQTISQLQHPQRMRSARCRYREWSPVPGHGVPRGGDPRGSGRCTRR